MIYRVLKLERAGHLAIITLNRPEKLNALDSELTRELHLALEEIEKGFPDLRAVVLTGAGRGFCSGADVSGQAQALPQQTAGGPPQESSEVRVSSTMYLAPHLRRIPQPVIAAVNGVAAGAGLSLALASDIRIASEEARFSAIFIKRSLVPDTGASVTLPALVGLGIAAEMAYTGRIYDAQWALKVGLVNGVVPASQLLPEARALAEDIAANPPIAVRSTKQLFTTVSRDLDRVIPLESQANLPSQGTEDRREAVLSFLEKRAPAYKGR